MIVSNSTILIYLAKIGKLNLLKKLFTEVFIPVEVFNEVVVNGKEQQHIEDGWMATSKASTF
ncbi:MAG: hypothetical protein MPEBLZ_02775 [Candidatus Methanoperedens nitroreducens]|uniref:Uncharacterized protein n=1 Tax=Candidatus Methanoperedens nitratireducens TaxID=1392998 RepID=A0A0P8AEK7_9EURY|nr:hypothetical protein [Candidatus Methanoperedens sp. BLZ2]KAB2947318.1 MAG: hypothetical protein F9K14_04480 [Candidatus Methanoperedens sp.]KPQ42668.1 MAG: hypothetical protein MPEBLZ_02775 [Candidatus Methanoperedens sp. BLZ1]MBZ0175540.1 hypothetical protein [Candidatus Methanoperedens nitroreducens]CAG0963865.1 hypothetical protein METP2_00971 [Methanosarcinales archaeon]MCX9080272.1 hypothetical protein [Candidatus Methanoperedens sp.]